jgi:hypothetical protein
MLHDLTISRFRCFRELKVPLLKRVNLFVGRNNAGKTTILEAAEILALGHPAALWLSPSRRGELIASSEDRAETEVDPSYLFYREFLDRGSYLDLPLPSFSLQSGHRHFECKVEPSEHFLVPLTPDTPPVSFKLRMIRSTGGSRPEQAWDWTLSAQDGLSGPSRPPDDQPVVNFLGTELPDLGRLWDGVLLRSEEEQVVEVLRLLVPEIGSLVQIREPKSSRQGFYIRIPGSVSGIPLGTFGEGLKRLLALTLQIVSAKGGTVLIDDIGDGLHHTVMNEMWRLVIKTARRFDVQVLATTHSLDCVNALGTVREESQALAADVAVHRGEKGAAKTVEYSIDEVAVATRHQLEIR